MTRIEFDDELRQQIDHRRAHFEMELLELPRHRLLRRARLRRACRILADKQLVVAGQFPRALDSPRTRWLVVIASVSTLALTGVGALVVYASGHETTTTYQTKTRVVTRTVEKPRYVRRVLPVRAEGDPDRGPLGSMTPKEFDSIHVGQPVDELDSLYGNQPGNRPNDGKQLYPARDGGYYIVSLDEGDDDDFYVRTKYWSKSGR